MKQNREQLTQHDEVCYTVDQPVMQQIVLRILRSGRCCCIATTPTHAASTSARRNSSRTLAYSNTATTTDIDHDTRSRKLSRPNRPTSQVPKWHIRSA